MRGTASSVAMIGAFASLLIFAVTEADAQRRGGGGGGGSRGGGATSMNRGGGGGGGGGVNRGGGAQRGGGGMNQGGFSRGGNYSGPSGGGNRASQLPAQGGNRGNINTGNINTGNVNRGNINTGNINTGNVNVNRGNVNVNVDNRYGYGSGGCCYGWKDYPVGAGLAIGMVAGVTAAAIGSRYYALPPSCAPYPYQTYTYYHCGGVYYQPQYQGDTVVYVVVNKPG